ncbi:MAG: WG repeat-containing protein [Acidobacteriota bacterium]
MLQRFVLTCLCLLSPLALAMAERELDPSKPKGADSLFRVHYGDKWGFMLRDGQVVIPPQFDWAGAFFEQRGRVYVRKETEMKVGYIDSTGQFVIEPTFDEGGDFREGLAPVRVGKEWGFIDGQGRFVVPPTFQAAGEFHEGLARVVYCPAQTMPRFGFPLLGDDFQRKLELEPRFVGRNVRFGFIDRTGKMVIKPQPWEMADDFSEGLAWVRGRDLKCRYIDRRGEFAFAQSFDLAQSFSEGLASVTVGGSCGYIDKFGNYSISATFDYCGNFSEGLAVVSEPQTDDEAPPKMGAIDKSGRYVIPPRFNNLRDFSEGLANARREGKRIFIDRAGKTVPLTDIPLDWWGFRDGLAIVGTGGKRVYIDRTGKVVAPFEK